MIWKVLKKNIKPLQITTAFVGVLFGLSILVAALLFYLDITVIFQDRDGFWREEYIVVNKNVHLSDTYRQIRRPGTDTPVFTEQEIDDIKAQPFIKEVAPFTASTYHVAIYTGKDSPIPGFYSDLFFESVPDKYIDVEADKWPWHETGGFLPIIVPRSYLNLYNFGFAQSQGLPQIAEEGIGAITFNVSVSGNGKRTELKAQIIGFSDRINTFLVPASFMAWANREFGSTQDPAPGRLIIIATDPSSPVMMDYFNENKLRVEGNIFNNARALIFLRTLTAVVLTIGGVIIFLALWLMMVSLMLVLERNQQNIARLSLLGYPAREISKPFYVLVAILMFCSWLVSSVAILWGRGAWTGVLLQMGYGTQFAHYYYAQAFSALIIISVSALLLYLVKKMIRGILMAGH